MGSPEARLSMADRALRRVGEDGDWFSSDEDSARCAAAMAWLRPAADDAAADAEASGEFHLPRAPPRLRDRDRDAGWTTDAEAEDGWAQVAMEEDLAARGVPEAQRHVGYRRLVGRGMARDEIAAARAFADAAEAGDAAAAFNLGYMHMRGVGVPLDYARAGELFRRAADANLPAAHNGVGVLRYNGWGTPRDAAAARDAFAAGAAAGDPDAAFNLGALHQSGVGAERNLTRAFELFQVASEAGHWRAPHALASAYLDGAGTSRDCAEAARLFWTFLEERLGWAETQERAVLVLDGTFGEVGDGDGVREKDASEDSANPDGSTDADERADDFGRGNPPRLPPDPWSALATFAALAESGSESAASNAAHMLRRDGAARTFAVDPDDAAARLFRRAARAGNAEAHVDLGDMAWDAVRAAGGPGPHVHLPDEEEEEGSDEREEKRARVSPRVPGTSGDSGDSPRGHPGIPGIPGRGRANPVTANPETSPILPPASYPRTRRSRLPPERPPRRRSRFIIARRRTPVSSRARYPSRGREYTASGCPETCAPPLESSGAPRETPRMTSRRSCPRWRTRAWGHSASRNDSREWRASNARSSDNGDGPRSSTARRRNADSTRRIVQTPFSTAAEGRPDTPGRIGRGGARPGTCRRARAARRWRTRS